MSKPSTQPYSEKTFSVRTVPDSWVDAQEESGTPDPNPLPAKRAVGVVPIRGDADVLTGGLAGLAMAVVVGASWYAFESQDVVESPWLAIPVGILIALAVRLGSGADHSDVRATVSLMFYFVTVFGVAYFVEAYDYRQLYNANPDFAASQTELVRDRLTEPETMLAWAIGLLATLQTGYLLRRRRSNGF